MPYCIENLDGSSVDLSRRQQRNDRQYLLTAAQFEAWQETGTDAACALVLGGRRDN